MDLRFTPEELAFRDEVRAFFRANLPDGIRTKLVEGKHLAKDDIVTWQRILNAKGWAVANWPVAWGGTGWTPVQQYIFQEELQQTPAPQPLGFGVTMVGPVIIAFGSEAQKKRYSAGASPISMFGGARDFPSPVRARISPLYGLRLSEMTATTSSTARRPGRPSRSTPIGSSAWCAPIRRPKSRKEFPFC